MLLPILIYLTARLRHSSRGIFVNKLSTSKETTNFPCRDRSLISFTKLKESEAMNVNGI